MDINMNSSNRPGSRAMNTQPVRPGSGSPSIARPYSKAAGGSRQTVSGFPTNGYTGSSQQGAVDMTNFPALSNGVQSNNQPTESFQQVLLHGASVPPGMQSRPGEESNSTQPGRKPSQSFAGRSTNPIDQFGINGLSDIIRMENNEQTAVAIGADLTNLGLDFNPNDQSLAKTFASPWIERPRQLMEPEFKLPASYNIPSVPPQQQRIQLFSEETLFYIFYTMPKDSMQEAAAAELTNRNWRYHKELKLWLTKDMMSEPIQHNTQEERGIYIFFDPKTWEKTKREYVLYYPDIA